MLSFFRDAWLPECHGEEQPLKAGDFAMVMPDEKHQYRNKGDVPFKMICGVPKEFE